MNDPMLAVDALDRIIDALKNPSALSVGELSGLYAATRTIKTDLDAYLEDRQANPYVGEKLLATVWHIGALTGFDTTNNHNASSHRVWALGAAEVLRRTLAEVVSAEN